MRSNYFIGIVFLFTFVLLGCLGQKQDKEVKEKFRPGAVWPDTDSIHINAHGGGILFHEGKYYWFGEDKNEHTSVALVGVNCYSSQDLYRWKKEGVALRVEEQVGCELEKGCTIERPKVIYNPWTGKFVMWFHLELKGQGYHAARAGVAVSDRVTGPYRFLGLSRCCAGKWPENFPEQNKQKRPGEDRLAWWTPEWRIAVEEGLFVRRDFQGGQMARDMTLFVDEDGKAYHIYASEDNLTLHIAELTEDYLAHTGRYVRVFPGKHNEAPALFKRQGKYWMITSGCTGWEPNAARLAVAGHILGPWKELPNPCRGEGAEKTFYSQGTFILPVEGCKEAWIFMADRWNPRKHSDGRYVWLPVLFENGQPVLRWMEEWDLTVFERKTINTK